jgi:threonine aldolase
MKVYDLRSATVTRPSPAMRKAMYEAEVGDDVYGEDPSVNKLQEMSALVTGKEAALFVSSGSMGNLIPIYLNCGKGNEVLCDSRAHIVQHELASATAIAGALPIQIPTARGILDVEQLESRVQPDIYYCARTKMIAIENTHNAAGGTFYPLATLKKIGVFARRRKMSVHMDGARLFNACAASGDSVKTLCTEVDTVTFCVSKGLGAPVGALICGTRDFIPDEVVTNIIYFRTPERNADDVVHALEQKGILSGSAGPDMIRFVTHLDISRKDTTEIARILQDVKL